LEGIAAVAFSLGRGMMSDFDKAWGKYIQEHGWRGGDSIIAKYFWQAAQQSQREACAEAVRREKYVDDHANEYVLLEDAIQACLGAKEGNNAK
jgi:hypothetical protein